MTTGGTGDAVGTGKVVPGVAAKVVPGVAGPTLGNGTGPLQAAKVEAAMAAARKPLENLRVTR